MTREERIRIEYIIILPKLYKKDMFIMNLFDYFNNNIHIDKINNIDEDVRELAIVRYVIKEAKEIIRDFPYRDRDRDE